jgi:hypothetical protein
MDSQDPTQQQGSVQSRAQSAAPGGAGVWYRDQSGQQPQHPQPQLGWGWQPTPTGSPLQPQQLQYRQQPQQPQYYAPPPPNFLGILHTLAQNISALMQTSIVNQQAITTLLAEHTQLANSIQHLNLSNQQTHQLLQRSPAAAGSATSITTKVHTMEKLEKFDGMHNNSTHTFLVCFALWAQSLGAQMNRLDAVGNCIGLRHNLWVQSALGYMTGKATVWAKPYMTQVLSGQTLSLNTATSQILWDKFQTAFCMWWIPVAGNVAACQKLVTLCQSGLASRHLPTILVSVRWTSWRGSKQVSTRTSS